MISRALHAEGIDDCYLVPIVDINQYSLWVAHVESMVPPFETVYSNNPLTRRLFEEAGYNVDIAPMFDRHIYSGTEVRTRMLHNEDWQSLVPPGVAETIYEVKGDERLRQIMDERL